MLTVQHIADIAFLHKPGLVIWRYGTAQTRRIVVWPASLFAGPASGVLVHAGIICSVAGFVRRLLAVQDVLIVFFYGNAPSLS